MKYISIGSACHTNLNLNAIRKREESLPFDSVLTHKVEFAYNVFTALLNDTLDIKDFMTVIKDDGQKLNRYNIGLVHFYEKKDFDKNVEAFTRRFKRLRDLILDTSEKHVFLFINPPDVKTKIIDINFQWLEKLHKLIPQHTLVYVDNILHESEHYTNVYPFIIANIRQYLIGNDTNKYAPALKELLVKHNLI